MKNTIKISLTIVRHYSDEINRLVDKVEETESTYTIKSITGALSVTIGQKEYRVGSSLTDREAKSLFVIRSYQITTSTR